MQQAFASARDRRDVLLVASRGERNPKLPGGGVDDDRGSIADGGGGNPSNERLALRGADANGLRFVTRSLVADVDVVVARAQCEARLKADSDILGAIAVPEGFCADCGVAASGVVLVERIKARGRVEVAGSVGP